MLLTVPASVYAYCPDWPDVASELARSEFVFVGTVTSESQVHATGEFYDGINYAIHITELLKGEPRESLVIFSENSSGRFPMDVGASYLIFTSLQGGTTADEPVYTISYCGSSGLVSEKALEIAEVRRRTAHP